MREVNLTPAVAKRFAGVRARVAALSSKPISARRQPLTRQQIDSLAERTPEEILHTRRRKGGDIFGE